MSTDLADPDRSSGVARLTVHLSKEHMQALQHLSEVYHATPERMAATWVAYQIERLVAGHAPDDGPDPARGRR